VVVLALQTLALPAPGWPAPKDEPAALVAAAEAKLDQGDAAGALPLLERALKREPGLARGYLLRATAHLILGDQEPGKKDLDRAIALDPALRQAFLNRAAVAMAEGRNEAALADFQKARDLDPADADGHLNVGVAELLLGQLDAAARSFESYLAAHPAQAQAQYLVARNYAMAGYAGLAIQSLQQAVALDERMRAAARGDGNFAGLGDNPRFQELLGTDSWRAPLGTRKAQRSFPGRYEAGRGPLLQATLDALHALRETYDPRVEVTPEWALLWGAMRIKLYDASGGGVVELSAAPAVMAEADWDRRSDQLLDSIAIQLAMRAKQPPRGSGRP
jgi:tetratricopeptide (TPR) repeat protein